MKKKKKKAHHRYHYILEYSLSLCARLIIERRNKRDLSIARSIRSGGDRGKRDDKSDRWQQLVLGKLAGHCAGTCYFGKSSLGSLPANFGGPCARNYYLLPGSRTCRWPATLGIWNAVMDGLSGFFGPRASIVNCDAVSLRFPSFPEMSSQFLIHPFLRDLVVFLDLDGQFSTLLHSLTI